MRLMKSSLMILALSFVLVSCGKKAEQAPQKETQNRPPAQKPVVHTPSTSPAAKLPAETFDFWEEWSFIFDWVDLSMGSYGRTTLLNANFDPENNCLLLRTYFGGLYFALESWSEKCETDHPERSVYFFEAGVDEQKIFYQGRQIGELRRIEDNGEESYEITEFCSGPYASVCTPNVVSGTLRAPTLK